MNASVIFRAIAKCLILFVIQLMSGSIVHAQTPIVGVPCYVNGPSTGSTQDAFVGVLYNPAQGANSLSSGASAVSHLATFGQIGATWGDAYDSRNNSFYAAAALKRHSGYGPNGSGAIYKISADNTATAVSLLIDLDGKTGTLANGTSVVINTGASTDHGNLASLSTPGTDNPAFSLAGKTGLGDIDLSPTRNTLWVVNAKGGEVIEVNVSNPASPTVGKVYPVTSSTTGVTAVNGVLRPWGLEIANDGTVYVGVVATAENVTPAAPTTAGPINLSSTTSRESIANRAKLKGYVFKLDKVTGTYTQVLAIDLDYLRGNPGVGSNNTVEWVPWFDDYTQGFPNIGDGWFQLYPQPLVADIEIMDDGSMLVSLMDRFGLQTGSEGNSKPGASATSNENGRASGDVVRVVKSGATWSSTMSNRYGDAMSSLENAAALGGIAYKSGTNEFIAVTVDAISASTNGIVVMSQAGAVLDNQDLVTYAANPLLGSKGLALGDVEIGTQGVVAVCTIPTIVMTQLPATCSTSGTPNNDGALAVITAANADRYGVSAGSTYAGPAYASATFLINFPDTLQKNIPNTGGVYTIRYFSGDDACFKDTTITVAAVTCTVPITCTPQVLPLCQGESYTLSVPKSGMTGIQWYKDGVAIPAPQGTADTLVVSTVGVYNVTGFQAGAVCKDSSCCPVMVVAGTNCPCSLTASVTQSACNNNGTATWAGDDYFTVTVNASITNGAAGLYEVVFGANADGTGGNVLNSGGTPFGTPVTVGSAGNLKADNQVYSITIRSLGGSVMCFDKKTLTAVQSCASAITCPPVVCTPIGFSKN